MQSISVEDRPHLGRLIREFKVLISAKETDEPFLNALFPTAKELADRMFQEAVTFDDWRLVYECFINRSEALVVDHALQRLVLLTTEGGVEYFHALIYTWYAVHSRLADAVWETRLHRGVGATLPWGVGHYEQTIKMLFLGSTIHEDVKHWLGCLDRLWQRMVALAQHDDPCLRTLVTEPFAFEPWKTLACTRLCELKKEKEKLLENKSHFERSRKVRSTSSNSKPRQ